MNACQLKRGIIITQPEAPRGWKGSCFAVNFRNLQSQFVGNRPISVEEFEGYFVGVYVATFEAIIGTIEARYNISHIILEMEKYLAATNDIELA